LRSERSGFYLSVIEEGEVGAGDVIELVSKDENNITVTDITQLYVSKGKNQDLLRRAAVLEALPASWRDYFLDQIEEH